MSYVHDVVNLRYGRVDDTAMRFARRPATRERARRSA
jgi:hypothetical protein